MNDKIIETLMNENNKKFYENQEILGKYISIKECLKKRIDNYQPKFYEYSEKSIGKVEAYQEILNLIKELDK